MPAPHLHIFYQHAFLQRAPHRYALMLIPTEAQRLDQNYDERRGPITDVIIARHLAGEEDLAVPAAVDSCAYLPPLDVDTSGIAAILALIADTTPRSLWSFGQYCPRISLDNQNLPGYALIRTRSGRSPSYSAPTARTPRLPLASPTAGRGPARRRTIGAP